jgi:hypothetical protein
MTQVSASEEFEFVVDLTGIREPGLRPTHNDPGHEASIEDVTVEGLRYVTWGKTIDLLDGIDRTNPEVRKLLANIAAALGDSATDALADNL